MDVWFPRTENVFLRVILLLFPYMTFHISSPCLDMHWTRKNPRQEIPRRFTTRNSLAISVCDIAHIKPLPRHALDNRKSSSGNPSSNPPRPNWYSPVGCEALLLNCINVLIWMNARHNYQSKPSKWTLLLLLFIDCMSEVNAIDCMYEIWEQGNAAYDSITSNKSKY